MDKVKNIERLKVKKRKLSLEQIGKCNPKITSKNKCIPNTVYSKLSKILHTSDVFKAVGCNDGEENCLINKAPLNDNENLLSVVHIFVLCIQPHGKKIPICGLIILI